MLDKVITDAIATGRVTLAKFWYVIWDGRRLTLMKPTINVGDGDTPNEDGTEDFTLYVALTTEDQPIDNIITEFYPALGYEVVCKKFGRSYDLVKEGVVTKRVEIENNTRGVKFMPSINVRVQLAQ